VPEADAKAMIGDMMARIPEHREEALRNLQALTQDVKDNEAARRGLARDHIEQKRFDAAADELEKATEINPRDAWIWYYRSVLKYREAQAARQDMRGLANMMQDLRAVLDWYPELADAYNMLGMARVEGGGINSALEAQRQAIALAPRNVEYQFNLGQIYVAGKKWDQARDVFTRIASGTDRQAGAAAKQQLDDLDTLQKYGIRPQRAGQAAAPAGAASAPVAQTGKPVWSNGGSDDDDEADTPSKPAVPNSAKTANVENLKGKIVVSDCSKPPGALITVISGMTTYSMHSADYKSLLVIGEDQFSCDWKNRAVSVNYRPTGKNMGEVVSIELR
jgi:tetratricopeptide (TPR) repeat protein